MNPGEEAESLFQQGMRCVRERDFASAAECFARAATLDSRNSRAHNNLGSALAVLGRHEEAVEAFGKALAIEPDYAQAHFNLGASLRMLGMNERALPYFVRTLELDPYHDEAYFYLGRHHHAAGRLNDALACYLRASELNPNEADIFTSMAEVLAKLRLPGPAAQALEQALYLNPEDSMTRAHLMDQLARECDWDKLNASLEWVPTLGVVGGPVPPFGLLTFDDSPERNRLRSAGFAATFPVVEPLEAPARPPQRPEKLRVGYFSADFHDHATMFLAARMFELHDRDRFEIYAYSYGSDSSGAMRERAERAFDKFNDVRSLSNRQIAERARSDGIDIAVDLKGYTEFQRIGIFAYRPAPIQMTFLGYPGTLGAPFIDYNIVDEIVVPEEDREAYSERLIYLPHSYQVNDDTRYCPQGNMARSAAGLPEDSFVFCCFNYSYKISPAEFGIWMDLLRQVEGSVLWLLASPGSMEHNLRKVMQRERLDPARLIIAPRIKLNDHLARLQCADLFLDTFNYNAHTTASDALWVGVPVVTKAGKGFAARVAASLLNAVGLGELVTSNEREYAKLALTLARDHGRLATIRENLSAARATSPLFDTATFTQQIEAGYDQAFQRYVDGLEPADIKVAKSPRKKWRARKDSNL